MNLLSLEYRECITAMITVFRKYYSLVYRSEVLGETNAHKYLFVDERLFCTDENKNQIWVLGVIYNISKDLHLDIAYERNQNILKLSIVEIILFMTVGQDMHASIMERYARDVHIMVVVILYSDLALDQLLI